MNMFSLEHQTLIEGPSPPPTPRQRLRLAGGTHICYPLLSPSSSPMHSPLYHDTSLQHVCAIPGTRGPPPGLWAGRYSPLEEVTDCRETEPDCPGLYQPFPDLCGWPHLPPRVQHIRGSDRRALSCTWSLCPGKTLDLCSQWETSGFPQRSCNSSQESLRKLTSLATISHGTMVAPAMPCKVPVKEPAAATGSAGSPLDVQTAQQLSAAPVTWASPRASAFQRKNRQVTSVDIYSPTQHDRRCRKMLAWQQNPSRRLEPLQTGMEYQRAPNLISEAMLSVEAVSRSRC